VVDNNAQRNQPGRGRAAVGFRIVGVAELSEAWNENSAQIAADYEEWDRHRLEVIPLYVEALDSFLAGESDLATLRSRIDSLSKSEPHWGFRGTGQMFFNQLVKAADPVALTATLKAVLPAPADEAEARRKLEEFQAAVEDSRERAEASGATKPGIGRVDSFVSFFWELQDHERWPMFFPNSRDLMDQHEILDVNQSQPDLYLSFLEVMGELREALGTGSWGVEHLLWRLGKGSEKTEPGAPPAEPGGAAAGPGSNLYARYREQGLHFPDEVVTSLVLSLATKRFAILSGISGTGKTRIALGLAKYLEASAEPEEGTAVTEPETDPGNVYVKLTAPTLKRGFVSLISEGRRYFAEALGLPERGSSRFYSTRLPDGSRHEIRLNNIDFSNPARGLYRLYLRKDAAEWLRENARPGDFLRLALKPEEGVDLGLNVLSGAPPAPEAGPKRYATVAVRSDWTDPRGLIGYFNPLTGSYVRTDLIELLLRAGDDPGNPYILILDEMNLARVEYYFSDFLSSLESGEDLRLMAPGVEEESAASSRTETEGEVPGEMAIPPNVSFVGTVNVDETTHAFSPKVLDRANVIEFGEVDVERALGHGVEPEDGGLRLRDGAFSPAWLCTSKADSMRPKAVAHEIAEFVGAVEDVHAILAEFDRPFGYRVIDEVSAFVGHAVEKAAGEQEEIVRRAFDLQLQQKILPKLSGGRELEAPLAELLDYCLDGDRHPSVDPETVRRTAAERLKPREGGLPPRYPGAAGKILRMLSRLGDTGFVGALE
jgi:hypothetical protein